MGINWNQYLKEKKQIKLKYLELLKRHCKAREINLREEVTKWALGQFPYLKVPKKQFAGTFDHSKRGFFIKENGFVVTSKAIETEAAKRKISAELYIEHLINKVNLD